MFLCEMKQNQIRSFLNSLPVFYWIIFHNVKQEGKALRFLSVFALTPNVDNRCFSRSFFTQADVQAVRKRIWTEVFSFA